MKKYNKKISNIFIAALSVIVFALITALAIPSQSAKAAGTQPEELSFETSDIKRDITTLTFLNPLTVSPADASTSGIVWESSNDTIAKVGTDGTVTFLAVGSVEISAKAPNGISSSYNLRIYAEKLESYVSYFGADFDGWIAGKGGRAFDKVARENGAIKLEGSDLGNPDRIRNSWVYRAFQLNADYLYFLSIIYSGNATVGSDTEIRFAISADGDYEALSDWIIVPDNTKREFYLDISKYHGKLIYLYIEQGDNDVGSGEVAFVYNVEISGSAAANPVYYHISGVTNADAAITVLSAKGEEVAKYQTGENGKYFITVEQGQYTVKIEKEGYDTYIEEVLIDSDLKINRQLSLEAEDDNGNVLLIVGLSVGGALLCGAGIFMFFFIRKKHNKKENNKV